uniref:IS1634 family transposase n=1 Tax=Mycolicibacterium sarraceniae TaxID=1534348 RepID=UPI0038995AA8
MGLLDQTGGPRHQDTEPAGTQGPRSRRRRQDSPHTTIRHSPKRGPYPRRSSLQRARHLVGLKGYVTNIDTTLMPATEIISSYHDLWRVEQSFRMSKSDLAARPMFARTRDAIEAHLTIVFTALALSREIQTRTGLSLRRFLRTLKPLRNATIDINAVIATYPPAINPEVETILNALKTEKSRH